MGISGLLLALKSIQVTKHLSEFSGQTIAVDAYVWLHKAVYSCATELATGQATCKYVNYAMERVRILRHHGIEPYIVFDGGPLQAKRGTESERKKKREDNIAKGHMFAAQGNHSAARECYTKAVDVTPQMAFQLIKALRAENVKYVVAPYEADAQLAFLEKKGLVSAILTEDSDLLVFGCKTVLFKLDAGARTVVSISQTDFASVTPSTDANSISLVGWSDKQFREMAILSGCDYLPSIPGVGLKTACTMLRKWKTPEQVIRSILLEGKKIVPKGYIQQFRLAEKCFLYQRVYDPETARLVHLNDVPSEGEWDEVVDSFVGRDLEASLAKAIAMGDKDPVSYETMEDINPNFVPRTRVLREIPFCKLSVNRPHKGKGKMRDPAASEGILDFFGPNPKILQIPKPPSTKAKGATGVKNMIIGKESGKRTLPDIHDEDMNAKKRKTSAKTDIRSKFFSSAVRTRKTVVRKDENTLVAGSCLIEKENEYIVIDEHETDAPAEDDSIIAQHYSSSEFDSDVEEVEEVEQEDGYMSPTPSLSRNTQELSSPPRPRTAPQLGKLHPDDFDFGAESISSPPSGGRSRRRVPLRYMAPPGNTIVGKVLIEASPEIDRKRSGSGAAVDMLDLGNSFGDELTETEFSGDEAAPTPFSFSPCTLENLDQDITPAVVNGDEQEVEDAEELEQRTMASRNAAVAAGWRSMWSLGSFTAKRTPHEEFSACLRRSGTNVTPTGRHRLSGQLSTSSHPYLQGHTKTPGPNDSGPARTTLKGRQSLIFFESKSKTEVTPESSVASVTSVKVDDGRSAPVQESEVDPLARVRLEKFRLVTR
ncbi:hypothetical protein E1B28_006133 [Marasmius oreades]|uniref:Exonuclease 1 n=1 Tax=Marasmius oreades TaxID=181124 RepID=A0A9P7S696_9AGAR|nr:uncharacterized protein E1B28_006133 [Marasmius oreades]KAG7095376.1 hypothetical protein E1B28_006133 [Marasmius oreades]